MQIYSYGQALYMSLYSKALYLDVGRGRRGFGFGYLALLAVLCAAMLVGYWTFIVSGIHITLEPSNYSLEQQEKPNVNQVLSQLIAQVPTITIKNGEASITEAEPYTIYLPENKRPFAIIDSMGSYVSLDKTDASILLTKTQLFYRKDKHHIESYYLNELTKDDWVIDANTIVEWARYLKKTLLWMLPLVVFPLFIAISFLYIALRSLIFGGIGMVIGNVMDINDLKFKDYFRIAAFASTPIIVINLVLLVLPVFQASLVLDVLIFAVGIAYVYFAVKVNRWL